MTNSPFEELRSIANQFGNPELKKKILLETASQKLPPGKKLQQYHHTILFLLAYPENEEIYELAKSALEKIAGENEKKKNTLVFSPSFDLLKRMNLLCPGKISIHSSAAENEKISSVFKILLPVAEHETIDKKDLPFLQRVRQLQKGNRKSEIVWLLDLFEERFTDELIIDHFFNSLEIYFSIALNDSTFSSETLRSLSYAPHFHNSLQKKADAGKMLDEKINKAISTSVEERIRLADVSRLALILLGRETDPSTYANTNDMEWHNMGNGFYIALYGMIRSRRLPFDSYIGYMAFKNGIPAAYGGAWMMGDGAKVGVNIFETLRGGESAWMFCQILRLYRQRYGVEKFVVEPYQYGKNNQEGINSGAFWFYYRLGFRPMDEFLKMLADREAKIISEQKGYRTSKETLRKFTQSNIELCLSEKEILFPDTESLSVSITKHIAEKFSGNRKAAISFAKKYLTQSLGLKFQKWNISEKKCFENLCLLFLLIPGIEKWKQNEKNVLVKLLKSKGGEAESEYIFLLKQNKKLLRAISTAK